MSLLNRIQSTKFNLGLQNSNDVVSDVQATIRSLQIIEGRKDDLERVQIFINLEADGKRYADVITFYDGNEEATHQYFALHVKPIFSALDMKIDLEKFEDVITGLKTVMNDKMAFSIWTVPSENNPEYVDVLYAEPQQ